VVLPYPAGATTDTTGPQSARISRSISERLPTAPGRTGGRAQLRRDDLEGRPLSAVGPVSRLAYVFVVHVSAVSSERCAVQCWSQA
jgi:hypothetical protein